MPSTTGSDGSSPSRIHRTRIVLVQPHTLVRQGMLQVLDAVDDVDVVAHTGSGDDAPDLVRDLEPDLLIVDGDLDGGSVELVAELHELAPEARILVLAEGVAPGLVEQCLTAGAEGYLLKDISIEEFTDAVRRLASGEVVMHPQAAAALAAGYTASIRGERAQPRLTRRQLQILSLLAQGLGNKQIARELGIGTHTVKTHVSRILDKLDVSSRTEAVVVAMRDRLIG